MIPPGAVPSPPLLPDIQRHRIETARKRPEENGLTDHHWTRSNRLASEEPFQLAGFSIERDDDITKQVSPNFALLKDLLENRISPALGTTGGYLKARYPLLYRTLVWFFRKKIERIRYKYLSGYRSQETFERYKSYRLVVLRNHATST